MPQIQYGVGAPVDRIPPAPSQASLASQPTGRPTPVLRRHDLDLTAAHTQDNPLEVRIAGTVLWAVEGYDAAGAPDPAVAALIRFNGAPNAWVPWRAGRLMPWPFQRLYVANTAQAGCKLVLLYWTDPAGLAEPLNTND